MTLYRAVEIDEEGGVEPVQYVGTYVLRWPRAAGAPGVGFVEANEPPPLVMVREFLDMFRDTVREQECPLCGEKHSINVVDTSVLRCQLWEAWKSAVAALNAYDGHES